MAYPDPWTTGEPLVQEDENCDPVIWHCDGWIPLPLCPAETIPQSTCCPERKWNSPRVLYAAVIEADVGGHLEVGHELLGDLTWREDNIWYGNRLEHRLKFYCDTTTFKLVYQYSASGSVFDDDPDVATGTPVSALEGCCTPFWRLFDVPDEGLVLIGEESYCPEDLPAVCPGPDCDGAGDITLGVDYGPYALVGTATGTPAHWFRFPTATTDTYKCTVTVHAVETHNIPPWSVGHTMYRGTTCADKVTGATASTPIAVGTYCISMAVNASLTTHGWLGFAAISGGAGDSSLRYSFKVETGAC